MVKRMIFWILLPVLAVCLYLAVLSVLSRNRPELGVVHGRLSPCPDTPNCVNSEDAGSPSFIEPLAAADDPRGAWSRARKVILNMGGNIEREQDGYLRATFTTAVFRFVDDVEMRLDEKQGIIHVRSASRVGRSDLGVNRRRVERLRAGFDRAR